MSVRIASAVVGILVGTLLVFGWGGILFAPAVGILALIGVHEFYRGVKTTGAKPVEWAGWIACIVLISSAVSETVRSFESSVLLIVFLITLVCELFRRERALIRNVAVTVMGAVYAGWLFSFLVTLRGVNASLSSHLVLKAPSLRWLDTQSKGAWLVMFLLLLTWACDAGAYFTGRVLGKHKLAPSLSPGKTVEGAMGGIIGSIVVALLTGELLGFSVWVRLGVGALVAIACIFGDLVESAMKREIGIKDFGSVMPGHGGILDRFDSLLFSGPALYYFIVIWFLKTALIHGA